MNAYSPKHQDITTASSAKVSQLYKAKFLRRNKGSNTTTCVPIVPAIIMKMSKSNPGIRKKVLRTE